MKRRILVILASAEEVVMLNVGVVGAGLQAHRRIPPIFTSNHEVKIEVIGAASLKEAESLAKQFNVTAVKGWQAVLERELDIVLVLTPPNLHHQITIAAMKKGIDVLCEKPLSTNLKEAEEMVRISKETKRILKCGFNHRHHPAILKLREWFEAGRLGKPLFSRSRYGIIGRPGLEKEWRADPKQSGGGELIDRGIHAIDLFRWFLGEFSEVFGFLQTSYWPIAPLEDNAFCLLRTSEGAVAELHSSLTQWKNLFHFEIFGTEGYATAEGLGGSYGLERAIFGKKDFIAPFAEEKIEFRGEDVSWKLEWEEFLGAVKTRQQPMGNGADGLAALKLVFALYDSAKTGKMVTIK
ncbi:Gfo/Idh/MocA family oxidoreductase [Candidatus Berkelbacteria bacterium]|nr:Gfo/Idh/MocA family oxidoreductase [Candidatus Berkelbacteria bacterium]MBI4029764.1 Gfo/Idh/MocA family oxidoreductase [Candidatus Berkelbacteria bacterium]